MSALRPSPPRKSPLRPKSQIRIKATARVQQFREQESKMKKENEKPLTQTGKSSPPTSRFHDSSSTESESERHDPSNEEHLQSPFPTGLSPHVYPPHQYEAFSPIPLRETSYAKSGDSNRRANILSETDFNTLPANLGSIAFGKKLYKEGDLDQLKVASSVVDESQDRVEALWREWRKLEVPKPLPRFLGQTLRAPGGDQFLNYNGKALELDTPTRLGRNCSSARSSSSSPNLIQKTDVPVTPFKSRRISRLEYTPNEDVMDVDTDTYHASIADEIGDSEFEYHSDEDDFRCNVDKDKHSSPLQAIVGSGIQIRFGEAGDNGEVYGHGKDVMKFREDGFDQAGNLLFREQGSSGCSSQAQPDSLQKQRRAAHNDIIASSTVISKVRSDEQLSQHFPNQGAQFTGLHNCSGLCPCPESPPPQPKPQYFEQQALPKIELEDLRKYRDRVRRFQDLRVKLAWNQTQQEFTRFALQKYAVQTDPLKLGVRAGVSVEYSPIQLGLC